MAVPATIARGGMLATLTLVTACGADSGRSAATLVGGIPATTDLWAATGLPAGSVHSVVRATDSWRVLYRATAGSAPSVAARLCALEGRAPAAIRDEPIAGSHPLPGARKITITCRG